MIEKEYVDFTHLYEIGLHLSNMSNLIKESITNIDSYLNCLNDKNIWVGKAKDTILEKYLVERENLNLLYLQLVNYSKTILEVVLVSEDFSVKASKIIEGLNENFLWLR